jgi:hypothetical protein
LLRYPNYLARLRERVIDIEKEDCVLERTLLERWIDRCCGSHLEMCNVLLWAWRIQDLNSSR